MKVSQRDMAKALGVSSKRTIAKRIAQGMPMDSVESARAWCEKNIGAPRGSRLAGTQAGTESTRVPDEIDDRLDLTAGLLPDKKTLDRMLTAARIKLTKRDAAIRALQERQAQTDADLRDGKLVRAEDVQKKNSVVALELRNKLMELPTQWALHLAAMTDPALVAEFTRKRLKAALVEFCVGIGVITKEAARADHPSLDLRF